METIKKLLLRYNITLDELAQLSGIDSERLKYILSFDEPDGSEENVLAMLMNPYAFYQIVVDNEQVLCVDMVQRSLSACAQFTQKLEQVVCGAEKDFIQNG